MQVTGAEVYVFKTAPLSDGATPLERGDHWTATGEKGVPGNNTVMPVTSMLNKLEQVNCREVLERETSRCPEHAHVQESSARESYETGSDTSAEPTTSTANTADEDSTRGA